MISKNKIILEDIEHESTIYCDDSREEMVENDEISPWEEAFMRGWDSAWDGT